MQNKIEISVIIPNYNRCLELIRAVKSVLAQTYPVLEIIICDDGSTDDAKKEIEKLNNSKVIWIDCGRNGGPAIPRNVGVQRSRGNWLAFLDNDDEWMPNKVDKQVEAIEINKAKAVCCNANQIQNNFNKGSYSNFTNSKITLIDLMLQNDVICSSVMIQKAFLLDVSLFPEEKKFISIEDYALWLRVATKTDFVFVNENLLNYYDNNQTSIRSNYTDTWVIFEIVYNDFKNWIKKSNIRLSSIQTMELKKLMKKIKNKGVPSQWDEFIRKFNSKFIKRK